MDEEAELVKLKWLIFAGLAFLVSSFFAWTELRYALWSRTTEAEVVDVFETETIGRRGRRIPVLAVEYRFTDEAGVPRFERDEVARGWQPPANRRVAIEYFPGENGGSRLAGNRNWRSLVVFFGTLAVLAFAGWKLWREAREAVAQSDRFSRSH